MNTQLFKIEFRRDLKVFLIVTLVNTGFLMVTLLMYTGMKESLLSMTQLYESMPDSFAEALNLNTAQWTHILGFYASYLIYYGPLFLGMYAMYIGGSIVAKEEYLGTAEFLLAKPISRTEILSTKILVMFTFITGANLALWLNGIIWSGADSGFANTFQQVSILHVYVWFICLLFGALGLQLSLLLKRARSFTGPGIGIVFGCYMLDIILRITDKADFLLYATPFKYLNLDLLNLDYRMEWWRILITGGATALLLLSAYAIYRKKNILV